MRFDLSNPAHLSAALAPDILVLVGAMVLLLVSVWNKESEYRRRQVAIGALVITLLAAVVVVYYWWTGASAAPGIIAVDNFRWAANLIFLLATAFTLLMGLDYDEREDYAPAEAHVLLLFATSGMMLLAAARDLMIVFLGIELMSIAVYVLAGIDRRSSRGAEAALKYFLLGAFATGFLLYGIALIYGAAGSTNLQAIGEVVAASGGIADAPMMQIGIALLLVGFAFKVAVAPFHMWAPDVYDGAPTPYTAYMATAVKAGAFAAFVRVWLEAFPLLPQTDAAMATALWYLAVLTMVVGNVVALAQQSIKRLLAYSSIAHAGYVMVAIVVGTPIGASAFLFYLVAYTLATVGAFAVVMAVSAKGERRQQISDYAGLWRVRPWLALAMAVYMLALLGFPIVGGIGFFAKWYVIEAALEQSKNYLAIWLVLTSVVSAGYYLYVVMVMFMRPRPQDAPELPLVPGATRFVIGTTVALILLFGVYPQPVIRFARAGTLLPMDLAAPAVAGDASPVAGTRER
ncbi:MAG TPA: NADH-quinone oxidoreductase subunit N [Gemmatimonadaceae bacterium]|nr:NADH-quinone oxidoreductase subunit N [Gemmatimonadaceae bacterium]